MGLGRKKVGLYIYYLRGGVGFGDLSMVFKNLYYFFFLNVYLVRYGVVILIFLLKKF